MTIQTSTESIASLDVGELYLALAEPLEQIVRFDVRAPDVVIEDACQFAWSRLVVHSARVRREAVLSWLVKTAVHEAFKLIRRSNRCASLDALLDQGAQGVLGCSVAGPAELVAYRERLRELDDLPDRQRQMVWLHALGFSYAEIALETRCSERTVERQLLRAKRRLREA
jgi:RNA polymerase sigma-70 factor (ECF subfamily)